MNILYLSYWGINEPLVRSTIFPYLRIIGNIDAVKKIYLVTVERNLRTELQRSYGISKMHWCPVYSRQLKLKILTKISDFVDFPSKIQQIIASNKVDLIMCRGVMAGALGYKAAKKSNLPLFVESFEPHADYMVESGEWAKNRLKYLMQKKWEKKELIYAKKIITVSNNYKRYLMNERRIRSDKLDMIPCCTDTELFRFRVEDRTKVRKRLGIPSEAVVGIYVGKFGGIYYEQEAYDTFKKADEYFGNLFRLIVLTPTDMNSVTKGIGEVGLAEKTNILYVKHEEVPQYLCGADFAFSTIKYSPSRKYCCPVKNGEYWANGLPILLTDGVGDDYQIINNEGGGALFNLARNNIEGALKKIESILSESNYRQKITKIAQKYRSYSIAESVYKNIIK
ncbi:MAG: glycosyltransferase [Cyclobacteriaceae bacterium]